MGYVFNPTLEPVALIDENVCLLTEGGRVYAKILCIEAMPEIIKDLGPLTNGNETDWIEITEVQVPFQKNRFVQVRFFPIDNLVLTAKQPNSCQKWAMTDTVADVSKFIEEYNGVNSGQFNLTEFFQHGEQGFYMKAVKPDTIVNPVDDKARVLFHGFTYTFEVLKTMPEKYTVLPMASCDALNCMNGSCYK